jgi:hypothetical protein
MNSDIPPPEPLEHLSPREQAELRQAIRVIETAVTICFEADIGPNAIANVLLSAVAKIIGCMNPKGRHGALRALRQNFPLMVEEYAITNREKGTSDNGG